MTTTTAAKTRSANPTKTSAAKKTTATAKTAAAVTKTPPVAELPTKPQTRRVEKPAAKAVKKAAAPVVAPKEKPKKTKLVRDSFTMPEAEYAVLGEVKKACLKAGVEVKKSELLRIGVALIRQLDVARLKEILADLPTLKAGRPKKNK